MATEVADESNRLSKRDALIQELRLTPEIAAPARNSRWETISIAKFTAFLAGVGIFSLVLFKSEPGFAFLLDHANLLFHEAGHPIYGLLSERLAVYGGTLGQLTFPIVLGISFWRKAEPVPFAVSWIWFFENFLNIARYMADARDQVLPLVGGGEHDWSEIFYRWHVLYHDTQIAAITRTIGWTGMAAGVLWIIHRTMIGIRSAKSSKIS